MIKTKRRKELEEKEKELHFLKKNIQELKHWCAADSGEIAFAMMHLEKQAFNIVDFREQLRSGKYTFDEYVKQTNKPNPS